MLKTGSIVTKFILVPIIFRLFGVLFVLLLIREYKQLQIKKSTSLNAPESIDSLERVAIGGMTQWIYLRGKNKHNPVLLFLQDGYGMPMIYRARDMSVSTGLENDFIMVFWDKRGEGKSRHSRLTKEIYQTENYVSDVRELATYLASRFKTPKIFRVAVRLRTRVALAQGGEEPLAKSVCLVHPLLRHREHIQALLLLDAFAENQQAALYIQDVTEMGVNVDNHNSSSLNGVGKTARSMSVIFVQVMEMAPKIE